MKVYINILFLFFCTCFGVQKEKMANMSGKVSYYRELDEFTLKGVQKIKKKKLDYPYVEIIEVDDSKMEITINPSMGVSYKKTFEYSDGIWKGTFLSKEDETRRKYYSYHEKDTLVEIEYTSFKTDKKYYLTGITIETKENKKDYRFSILKKIDEKPTNKIEKLPLSEAKTRGDATIKVVSDGNILIYEDELYNLNNEQLIHKEESCYVLGTVSKFWWDYLGYKCQKVDCSYYDKTAGSTPAGN